MRLHVLQSPNEWLALIMDMSPKVQRDATDPQTAASVKAVMKEDHHIKVASISQVGTSQGSVSTIIHNHRHLKPQHAGLKVMAVIVS